jgi:hypothetical protein
MTAPYETPDAVISGSMRHFEDPSELDREGHYLVRITYREGETRTEVVNMGETFLRQFVEGLMGSPKIRAVEAARLLFHGRKSFGSDFDPANFLKALGKDPAGGTE